MSAYEALCMRYLSDSHKMRVRVHAEVARMSPRINAAIHFMMP